MSTLGKIVTVLIVIASVCVGSLFVAFAKSQEDWHNLARAADESRVKAVDAIKVLRAAIADRNADYARLQQVYLTKEASLKQDGDSLRDQIAGLDREKQQLQTVLDDLKVKIEGLDKAFNDLNDTRKALESKYNEATTLSVQLRDANQDLRMKAQNMSRTIEDDETRIRELELQVAEVTKKANWYEQNWPGGAAPKAVAVWPTVDLTGVITDVDNDRKVAEISLGSRDKIVPDLRMIVSRDNKYLADLVVTKVDENTSVGTLETVKGEIRRGDNVTYTVKR